MIGSKYPDGTNGGYENYIDFLIGYIIKYYPDATGDSENSQTTNFNPDVFEHVVELMTTLMTHETIDSIELTKELYQEAGTSYFTLLKYFPEYLTRNDEDYIKSAINDDTILLYTYILLHEIDYNGTFLEEFYDNITTYLSRYPDATEEQTTIYVNNLIYYINNGKNNYIKYALTMISEENCGFDTLPESVKDSDVVEWCVNHPINDPQLNRNSFGCFVFHAALRRYIRWFDYLCSYYINNNLFEFYTHEYIMLLQETLYADMFKLMKEDGIIDKIDLNRNDADLDYIDGCLAEIDNRLRELNVDAFIAEFITVERISSTEPVPLSTLDDKTTVIWQNDNLKFILNEIMENRQERDQCVEITQSTIRGFAASFMRWIFDGSKGIINAESYKAFTDKYSFCPLNGTYDILIFQFPFTFNDILGDDVSTPDVSDFIFNSMKENGYLMDKIYRYIGREYPQAFIDGEITPSFDYILDSSLKIIADYATEVFYDIARYLDMEVFGNYQLNTALLSVVYDNTYISNYECNQTDEILDQFSKHQELYGVIALILSYMMDLKDNPAVLHFFVDKNSMWYMCDLIYNDFDTFTNYIAKFVECKNGITPTQPPAWPYEKFLKRCYRNILEYEEGHEPDISFDDFKGLIYNEDDYNNLATISDRLASFRSMVMNGVIEVPGISAQQP